MELFEHQRTVVRRAYPAAQIKPCGATLVAAFQGDEQISRPFSEPGKAWADAYAIARANGLFAPPKA